MLTSALYAAWMALAGCAPMGPLSTEQAVQIATAIDHAEAVYDRILASANLVLPFLLP